MGTLSTGANVFYPGLGGPTSTTFGLSLALGTCATGAFLGASGMLFLTWCGFGQGHGATTSGHSFGIAYRGATLHLIGEVQGELSLVPNMPGGQSCLSGANQFLVSGTVVLHHGV